jgi:hypothetical protein
MHSCCSADAVLLLLLLPLLYDCPGIEGLSALPKVREYTAVSAAAAAAAAAAV